MYLPYPGFFHKLRLADVFAIMDDVQYDRRFTNRNVILDPNGPTHLTIPINKKQKFSANMFVEINNEIPWSEYHWKKMRMCYSKAKYFSAYSDYFEKLYKKKWDLLFELDLETVKRIMEWLGIRIPIVRESELNASGNGTDRLISCCKALGADTYISGRGGRNYMDDTLFEKNNIKLEYQSYTARPYPQRFSEKFVPNLSIVDALFNLGADTTKILEEVDSKDDADCSPVASIDSGSSHSSLK